MADQTRRKANGNQPISRHPLFPAIVALWFGALFGLCSVAIEPAVIERAVIAGGIDSLIPMAAPPLGATARILIALAMTGLGGLTGALIARRIARPRPEASQRRRGAASTADGNGPAFVSTHVGGNEAAAPAPSGGRRESTRESSILSLSEFDLDEHDNEAGTFVAKAEAAAPASFALPPVDADGIDPEEPSGIGMQIAGSAPERTDEFVPAEGRGAVNNRLFETYSRKITARTGNTTEDTDQNEEHFVIPIAPLAPTMVDASESGPEYDLVENEEEDFKDSPAAFAPAFAEIASGQDGAGQGGAAGRIASAELDTLSQVQLLERLALAMAQRRDEIAQAAGAEAPEMPDAVAPPEPEPETVEAVSVGIEPESSMPMATEPAGFEMPHLGSGEIEAPVEEEPEAEAPERNEYAHLDAPETEFRPPANEIEEDDAQVAAPGIGPELPRVPAALRPVGYDSHDEDDALPAYIPPRHIGLAPDTRHEDFAATEQAAFDDYEGDDENEDDEVLEEGYSSLLDLSRPATARQQFVRIEDPDSDGEFQPVVVFPGEDAGNADPDAQPEPLAADGQPAPAFPESRRPFDAPGRQGADETERALRAALATLQRMSGAA